MGLVSDLSSKKIFFTVLQMHYTFYVFCLVAVSGWSLGAIVRAITQRPPWLFE